MYMYMYNVHSDLCVEICSHIVFVQLQVYTWKFPAYLFTTVDMSHCGQEELHNPMAENVETAAEEEALEAREHRPLGLDHKCQRIEERVKEELFSAGLRGGRNRERVRGLQN